MTDHHDRTDDLDHLDARLAANLDAVLGEISAPRRSWFERALLAVRVPEPAARLVAATPVLRVAWLVAVTVVVLFAASAGSESWRVDDRWIILLALAPLVPVVSVALAYGPHIDRAYEVTLVAPLSGLRLVLLRTAAVLVGSFAVSALGALVAPGPAVLRLAWLVPSIATTACTLALGGRLGMSRAAMAVGTVWLAVVVAAAQFADDAVAPFRVGGQITWAVIAVMAVALLVADRRRLDRWMGTS